MAITHKIQLLARFPTWPGSPPLYVRRCDRAGDPRMMNACSFSREMEIPTSSRTAYSRKHFVELPWVEQHKCTSVRIVLPIPREISAIVAFHEVVVLHVVHYRHVIDDGL